MIAKDDKLCSQILQEVMHGRPEDAVTKIRCFAHKSETDSLSHDWAHSLLNTMLTTEHDIPYCDIVSSHFEMGIVIGWIFANRGGDLYGDWQITIGDNI